MEARRDVIEFPKMQLHGWNPDRAERFFSFLRCRYLRARSAAHAPRAARSRYESPTSQGVAINYPVTPDGRYFVVRGRLWRMSDPSLPEARRRSLTSELMTARRAVAAAQRTKDGEALSAARAAVHAAKLALGERGPVWWNDGAPDYNRHLAKNTPYAAWHAGLDE